MINLKRFKSNLLKIDKNHCKGIDLNYIGHITFKKVTVVKIFTMYLCIIILLMYYNPLYSLVTHGSKYIVEKHGNKYLFLIILLKKTIDY